MVGQTLLAHNLSCVHHVIGTVRNWFNVDTLLLIITSDVGDVLVGIALVTPHSKLVVDQTDQYWLVALHMFGEI